MKETIRVRQRRVRRKMVCSVSLRVLGFGMMIQGGIGIASEGAMNTWGLGVLLAVGFLVIGIIMFWVGIEIQPYKDWNWEEDKEGDLLRKELKSLGGQG